MVRYTGDLDGGTAYLDSVLKSDKNFDVIKKEFIFSDLRCVFFFIDGFAKDDIFQWLTMFLSENDLEKASTAEEFVKMFATYTEVATSNDMDSAVNSVLSGQAVLLVQGLDAVIEIDLRTYPVRSVTEPEDDRVLRGARDGFVETIVFNTSLIRRHIRDPKLTMEMLSVGTVTKTDIVLSFIDGKCDKEYLGKLKSRLKKLDIENLSMAQESLAEALITEHIYNPFPKVRYTERPDTAAACIMEGSIALIIDGTPAVMLLPTAFFDFLSEANDYYFPPIIGSYLKFIRFGSFVLSVFFLPLWLLITQYSNFLPSWLEFLQIAEMNTIPILLQIFLAELAVDGLKLASINTPSPLAGTFSVIGGLILGDYAVQAGWFVPEVILYVAFVAILTFAQPSIELGYAFKCCRLILLILTGLFGVIGFLLGVVVTIILICSNSSVFTKGYLYPLVPFDFKKLKQKFIKPKIKN